MMEDLWTGFCGEPGGSHSSSFQFLIHSSSCINHALIICLDIVVLLVLLFSMFRKSSKTGHIPARFRGFSSLQILSAIVNVCLGFVYLCLGAWILEEKMRNAHTALPLNWWLLAFSQGFTWLLLSSILSLRVKQLPRRPSRLLSILAVLFSGIVCALSLSAVILRNEMSVKIVLDILSFPGATLLLLCVFKGYKYEDGDEIDRVDNFMTNRRI